MRRRNRQRETRVWHNPLIKDGSGAADESENPKALSRKQRAEQAKADRRARRQGARIIAKPTSSTDPEELERQRLVDRLLAAEGRAAITEAELAHRQGGFTLPNEQSMWLQLLEHREDVIVRRAIEGLAALLEEEEPARLTVLNSRLRRLAEYAEETQTQKAAVELRHHLGDRVVSSSTERDE